MTAATVTAVTATAATAMAAAAGATANTKIWGLKKIAISPFDAASGKKVLVILSALVESFGVSRMRDF